MEHFDTIYNSPSHIYCYALPFSPPSSWLHKYYTADLSQEVKVIKGILPEWGECSRTISFDALPLSLGYWKNTIALGWESGDIGIFDAITGGQVATLSGHTGSVKSLAFSPDGTLLVSGGVDLSVKLWDVQTGGVVKTFWGVSYWVTSVSISPDRTMIASGCQNGEIYLWNVRAGVCFCVLCGHTKRVNSVSFSPINYQLLISASHDNTVLLWSVDNHQIGLPHEGKGVNFSSDGTHFVSWGEQYATVRNSDSGVVVAKLEVSSDDFHCCCFSQNDKLVAGGAGSTIYVWDITNSSPHLIRTLVGHTQDIISLVFPSSLISVSYDQTAKFWQNSTSSMDLPNTNAMPTALIPSSIESVRLQTRDHIAISFSSDGVVKTWDILTGSCKASFQTPADYSFPRDAQLIEGRLICIWYEKPWLLYTWDCEKHEYLPSKYADKPRSIEVLRISGDGSKLFCLAGRFIQAWSIQTGEVVGRVEVGDDPYLDPLCMDGSKIWVCFKDSPTQGWDFEISGPSPIPLSNTFPDRPYLDFIYSTKQWGTGPSIIRDSITRKEVFQLVGRYAEPTTIQWDGWYLVAGYQSGEVLILDFNNMLHQ